MKTVILLTKQYPFGHLETYLNNEMEVFASHFDRVVLVPVDAYQFHELNPRIATWKNVEVFKVNAANHPTSFGAKIRAVLFCAGILFSEIITGREGRMHLKRFRFCLTYLKVCYAQATQLNQFILREGIAKDHMILYSYWLHKTTIVASMYRKRFRKQTINVSRAHSSDLYHKDWNSIIKLDIPPFLPFEHYKIYSSDHVYTISDHGCNYLKAVFPDRKNRFSVSRLGVVSPNQPGPFGNTDIFRIVTCSEILYNKRLHRIPEILKELKDLPIEWVHIGWGLDEDVQLVKSEIEKYHVQDKCRLLGRLSYADVISFYEKNQVNVILNLSQAEGIPVSLMEAIGFGVPGIVTITVGNPEIIDASCGFQVPVDFTAKQVFEPLRTLASDFEKQVVLRKGARKMYEERYSASKNYSEFARLLNEQLR